MIAYLIKYSMKTSRNNGLILLNSLDFFIKHTIIILKN